MVQRTFFVFLILAGLSGNRLSAQEGLGRFDPVIYLKMISMGDRYSDSRFLSVAHTATFFENYMIDKAEIIAFTLKQVDSSGTGWSMWLDFAMDRLGGKRLERIFAQKPLGDAPVEEYDAFLLWMTNMLGDKLGEVSEEQPELQCRRYEGEPGYEITVRITPPQEDGKRYLTLAIMETPEE